MVTKTQQLLNLDNIKGLNELTDFQAESIQGGYTIICYDHEGEVISAESESDGDIEFTSGPLVAEMEFVTGSDDLEEIYLAMDFRNDGEINFSGTYSFADGARLILPENIRRFSSYQVYSSQLTG